MPARVGGELAGDDDDAAAVPAYGGQRLVRAGQHAAPSRSRGRGRSRGTGRPPDRSRRRRGAARASSPAAGRAATVISSTGNSTPSSAPSAASVPVKPGNGVDERHVQVEAHGERGGRLGHAESVGGAAEHGLGSVGSPRDRPGRRCRHRLSSRRGEDQEEGQSGARAQGDGAAPRLRDPAGAGRQDLLHPVLLHPLGVDGAGAGRQRPDPGAEAVVLERRAAARRRDRLRRPGELAQRAAEPAAAEHPGARAVQDRALPDRRAPGEAGDRRRGRRHRLLRRGGPAQRQRRCRSTRAATSPSCRASGPAPDRCRVASASATGPPGPCPRTACS